MCFNHRALGFSIALQMRIWSVSIDVSRCRRRPRKMTSRTYENEDSCKYETCSQIDMRLESRIFVLDRLNN